MTRIDIHQHLWTEPLVQALAERDEVPFVRERDGLCTLFLAGERPYVIDPRGEAPARRRALLALDDLDGALVCLSSPLGIESLAREQALVLLDAYHEGALALGEPFGVWGAIALDRPDPRDVDELLDRGCVGLSLPAGALGSVDGLSRLHPLLARLAERDAPLLVHPGGGSYPQGLGGPSLSDPLWWPALTRYVAQMQSAWFAFTGAGRAQHRDLRVVFAMLAGLAPLHVERLRSRGAVAPCLGDALTFYETSSYGATALDAMRAVVAPGQILYGSDRPVVEPAELDMPDVLDWEPISGAAERAFGAGLAVASQ